jgi:hypothetical protein
MNNFKEYLIEQYVLGLIETMDIEGIGPVDSKIDSGNGAYNVLHGTNITYNGNETTFTTVNDVNITTSVIDKVTIHVGSGNVEERPVVQFNITIGNQQLSDIKFSIADRSQNEYPVLVSKQFVEDLDALIDVSKNYITSTSVNERVDKEWPDLSQYELNGYIMQKSGPEKNSDFKFFYEPQIKGNLKKDEKYFWIEVTSNKMKYYLAPHDLTGIKKPYNGRLCCLVRKNQHNEDWETMIHIILVSDHRMKKVKIRRMSDQWNYIEAPEYLDELMAEMDLNYTTAALDALTTWGIRHEFVPMMEIMYPDVGDRSRPDKYPDVKGKAREIAISNLKNNLFYYSLFEFENQ